MKIHLFPPGFLSGYSGDSLMQHLAKRHYIIQTCQNERNPNYSLNNIRKNATTEMNLNISELKGQPEGCQSEQTITALA
jgi:hypothetical protein